MRTRIASLAFLMACSVAAAKQPTVISGKVLGADGKPLRTAHVHLAESPHGPAIATVEAAKDGTFKLPIEKTGLFFLQMTGVDHQLREVPVLVERPETVKLDVRLKANQAGGTFENLRVIGDFNNWSFGSGTQMKLESSGVYSAEIPTTLESFPYQILGAVGERSVNGTESEKFIYDGGGDYRSVVTPKGGKVRIIFDPRKLPQSAGSPGVAFTDIRSTTAQLSMIMSELFDREAEVNGAYRAHMAGGGSSEDFSVDHAAARRELVDRLAAERNPILRQALLVSYLSTSGALDTSLARTAMKEIPPASPLWGLNPEAIYKGISYLPASEQGEPGKAPYVRKVIDSSRSPELKAQMLSSELIRAASARRQDETTLLYNRLTTEFPKSSYAEWARKRYNPNAAIREGKQLPGFAFTSLDDAGVTYTPASFTGKVYLIDFWATWCGPCVQEMEALHTAYEKHKGENFEILSLSFDAKAGDIAKFRGKKWKMPWKHAFVDGAFKSEAAKTFEVSGIPHPILVDESGKILAVDEALRGENLEKTLSSVLGARQTANIGGDVAR